VIVTKEDVATLAQDLVQESFERAHCTDDAGVFTNDADGAPSLERAKRERDIWEAVGCVFAAEERRAGGADHAGQRLGG